MRLLFLAKHLDGHGIGVHTAALGRWLLERGHAVGIVSAGGLLEPRLSEAGAVCFRAPYRNRLAAVANWRATLDAVRRFRPDVVHVQWRICSPYAELARRRLGVPYMFVLHTPRTRPGAFWGSAAVGVSTETYQELIDRFHVPPGRAHLIWNGRDAAHFRPPSPEERRAARAVYGLAPDTFVVGFVGRLDPVKRLGDLLGALPPGAVALVAGEGPEATRLAGHPGVRLVGWLADPRPVYWAADCFALASAREGLPLAGVEALLCGLPVAVPSPDLAADGRCGFLAGDHAGLSKALQTLAADPGLRARMSLAARRLAVQRFSLDGMGEAYLALYRQIAQASP